MYQFPPMCIGISGHRQFYLVEIIYSLTCDLHNVSFYAESVNYLHIALISTMITIVVDIKHIPYIGTILSNKEVT